MSDNPLYSIRQAGEDWDELDSLYEPYEGLFSFKIHHGGFFTSKPGMQYEGGKIDHADCINIDLFSVHEMDSIMEDLGYTGKQVMLYFFLKPGFDIDDGLLPLSSDQDVIKLSTFVTKNRLISVYIEHGKSNLVGYYSPACKKKCTIELIDDDDDEVVPSKPKKPKPNNQTQGKTGFRKMLIDWSVEPVLSQTSQPNDNVENFNVENDFMHHVNTHNSQETLENDNVDPVNTHTSPNIVGNDNVDPENTVGNENGSDSDSSGESSDGSDSDSSGEDSEDSDYLVDEENQIEDVEVDMRQFHLHIDKDVEYIGCSVPVAANVGVVVDDEIDTVNNEEFESASDADDNVSRIRNRLLKRLGKKKPSADGIFKIVFHPGQTFGSSAEVKELIKKHAVETRRELKVVKNDKTRVTVVCEGKLPVFDPNGGGPNVVDKDARPVYCGGPKEFVSGPGQSNMSKNTVKSKKTGKSKERGETSGDLKEVGKDSKVNKGGRGHKSNPDALTCPYRLHVSKITDSETWMVKTCIDEHKCLQSRSIKHCTSNFLAKTILQQIEGNPDIPAKALQNELQRKFELGLSKQKAQRAKKSAKGELKGDYTKQYNMLRDYIQELQSSNPGTTVKLQLEPPQQEDQQTRVFRRIYVCLGALKRGFKSAGRELLGLDGSFMSGHFPGQVLTAVTLDSNNGIYVVAYAVVEAETLNSWTWFLECLGEDLDLDRRSNFTFISDRQKGLIPALAKVFPCAEHRFCLKHIHENMKLQWRGEAFKNHLWKCASATTVQEFTTAMLEFKRYSEPAHTWLSKIPPQHWARSHFSGRAKSDVLLNNMCEVFNSKTVKARDRPIVHCLEYLREYLMIKIGNVGKVIEKCEGPLTPNATRLLELAKTDANAYTAVFNGFDKYQVSGPWGDQCVVDLSTMNCSCRKWEITGLPCKHAICVNWNMGQNKVPVGVVETWVDPIYRLDTWKLMYQFKINPTNGVNLWTRSSIQTTIIPPKYHNPVGRPRKKRRKTTEEVEMVSKGKLSRKLKSVKCKKCGMQGHNKRSCKVGSSQPSQASVPSATETAPSGSQTGPSASQTGQRASQTAPSGSQTGPSASQRAPTKSKTGQSASQSQRAQTASQRPPSASQTAPSSSQTCPRPVSPSFRSGGLVRSPGGGRWVKFKGTTKPT